MLFRSIIQGFQSIVQNRIVAQALAPTDTDFKLPWLMRLSWFRYLPPRLIGLGIFPVHVRCYPSSVTLVRAKWMNAQ